MSDEKPVGIKTDAEALMTDAQKFVASEVAAGVDPEQAKLKAMETMRDMAVLMFEMDKSINLWGESDALRAKIRWMEEQIAAQKAKMAASGAAVPSQSQAQMPDAAPIPAATSVAAQPATMATINFNNLDNKPPSDAPVTNLAPTTTLPPPGLGPDASQVQHMGHLNNAAQTLQASTQDQPAQPGTGIPFTPGNNLDAKQTGEVRRRADEQAEQAAAQEADRKARETERERKALAEMPDAAPQPKPTPTGP